MTRAKNGTDLEQDIAGHLEYLSQLANQLGVPDPVEEYFAPVVGQWSDLHDEADRWRQVGEATEEVTDALARPLGKLDAAWDGAAAESFIQYMQRVGLAGNDLSDAMIAMADVLDKLADGIREIVRQLADVLSETATTSSEAMTLPVQGDARTRDYLDIMRRPTKELFDSVRQLLEAFVGTCEGVDGSQAFAGVVMPHTFPEDNWTATPNQPKTPDTPGEAEAEPTKAGEVGSAGPGPGPGSGASAGPGASPGPGGAAGGAPAPAPGGYTVATEQPPPRAEPLAAAASSSTPAKGGGMGMPMMPMGAMGGGAGQGGDTEHKPRQRVTGDPAEIFGTPPKASNPVIGADDAPAQAK